MSSWIDYDKTFCGNECGNTKCYRHKGQLEGYKYPVSMALFKGTEDCEGWISPDEEISRKDKNNG